jgi:hypothetical protein
MADEGKVFIYRLDIEYTTGKNFGSKSEQVLLSTFRQATGIAAHKLESLCREWYASLNPGLKKIYQNPICTGYRLLRTETVRRHR